MEPIHPGLEPRVWQVGALCRAIADSLDARFNPVAVRGELSGVSRAASGHVYFTLKDPSGQLRCAMFRRAASMLEAPPRDGELVEVQGRLAVYEPRGDLQLIVETMRRAGQGALFEQFLRLKARLEAEGLFDATRKRPLPVLPRGIGLVTSLQAAALHDVATCLRRRTPHIPVTISPAPVQGAQAAAELVEALERLYVRARAGEIDVILLVRGGGSLEDLWSFNDERLARAIVRSPVPVVVGVGHETDFTIADFCADLRAPTPTAAAELIGRTRRDWLDGLQGVTRRLQEASWRRIDAAGQRLDAAVQRIGRPSALLSTQQGRLSRLAHRLRFALSRQLQDRAGAQGGKVARLRHALPRQLQDRASVLDARAVRLKQAVERRLAAADARLDRLGVHLAALDPRLVLQRGYALLRDEQGNVVSTVAQLAPGQQVHAALADGTADLTVSATRPNPP